VDLDSAALTRSVARSRGLIEGRGELGAACWQGHVPLPAAIGDAVKEQRDD